MNIRIFKPIRLANDKQNEKGHRLAGSINCYGISEDTSERGNWFYKLFKTQFDYPDNFSNSKRHAGMSLPSRVIMDIVSKPSARVLNFQREIGDKTNTNSLNIPEMIEMDLGKMSSKKFLY